MNELGWTLGGKVLPDEAVKGATADGILCADSNCWAAPYAVLVWRIGEDDDSLEVTIPVCERHFVLATETLDKVYDLRSS